LPLLAWRFVISAALLFVVAFVKDRHALRISLADLGRYSVLALTGYGAASVCFFYALLWADASVVAVLLYAYPALVMLVGWFTGQERPRWSQAVAVIVTFLGCALVVGIVGSAPRAAWQGVALGLGAAVGYTLFNLLSHRWMPGRSRLVMMGYTFAVAALLPIAGTVATAGVIGLSPGGWGARVWVLLGAIVSIPTFAAIVLYLEGIRGLGPAQAAVLSTTEPLFTIALAALFLGERLHPSQFAGAALVLSGVVFAEVSARASIEPAPS
jgi:drug/metabolite transporter (DMT)-like permease